MPRQSVVYSWWAQRWADLIESLDFEWQGRLSRGRSIARNQGVHRLQVRPGKVSAQVIGNYWDHYDAKLELPAFHPAVWAQLLDALAGEASYVAKLLARELPPELEQLCAAVGVSLFPVELAEIRARCTCPDPSAPCKHVLALHYAFAMAIDRDPTLLLQLRGRSRDELTAALRERWAREAAGMTGIAGDPAAEGQPQPAEGESERGTLSLARFYEPGPELDAFAASFSVSDTRPPTDAALLARMGRPPFAAPHEEPSAILAPIYGFISERALQAAKRGAKKSAGKRRRSAEGDSR
jgi:uncharacterized Zn finger protein